MRYIKKIKILFINASCLLSYNTAFAVALGDAANNIFDGANLFTKFFWAGSVLIGIFLLIGGLVNYREHRNNPKLIPMATVITYIVLGLFAIGIPFLNRLFGYDSYDVAVQAYVPRSN